MVSQKGLVFLIGLVALGLTWLSPTPSHADIYRHIDKNGVVHFTNVNKARRGRKKWKRIMKTGPGKAASKRGKKVDRIPPRDRDPGRYHRFDRHIQEASALYHIPVPFVRAVIGVESDYDPRVVSRAGAMGMMQLMPANVKGMGVVNPFDARQNIFGGTRLLRILANRFAGDLVLTIAAYHAGSGAVRKYGGIPPYQTTQRYVRMVLGRYYKLRNAALAAAK